MTERSWHYVEPTISEGNKNFISYLFVSSLCFHILYTLTYITGVILQTRVLRANGSTIPRDFQINTSDF